MSIIHDWLMGKDNEVPYYQFVLAKFNQMLWSPVAAAKYQEEQEFKERVTGKLTYDR